jgi:hypothetical protein
MFNVKLVCEGITDKIILEAVLFAYLQSDKFTINCIQPESSKIEGNPYEHGTGWKGVRSWCQMIQAAGGFEEVRALASEVDLLIIHVDAEIVFEAENNAGQPCPPPEQNVITAERIVMSWLGLQELPENLVIWVPSMMTEAWILRALFPCLPESSTCLDHAATPTCIECISDPKTTLLGKKPKLVQRKNRLKNGRRISEVKPITSAYNGIRGSISQAWPDLVSNLWSAARLRDHLSRALSIPYGT